MGVVVSFLVTYVATPVLIERLKASGVSGVDVHKPARPVCAEMGGLAILLGFVGAFCLSIFLRGSSLNVVCAFLTIVLVGFVGVVDDLFDMKQRYKPLLIALASVPLVLCSLGHDDVWFPYIGSIHFGVLYHFLLLPLGVATASNLTNMLAGFNGLEVGTGSIALLALGVLCAVLGKWEASFLAFVLFAAFVAFLRYNWYPARIFPGDTGTLVSGAAIASVSILGHVKIAAIVMLIPAGVDFTLKMISRMPFSQRRVHGDTAVMSDGTLKPPGYPALCHAFLNLTRLRERELVLALLLMEAIYAALGVYLTLLRYF